jgi:predicted  nucleic acid-binding Zn-ribbon protein
MEPETNTPNNQLSTSVEVLGLKLPTELAERLKARYQDKQLDKLTTSVVAREAHTKKIAELKARFDELTGDTSSTDNIAALNPKLRAALADRVMAKHENELLDILEQIAREQKSIKKIDDSFEGITELL